MNYQFFAGKDDKFEVLKYIFEETELKVFDSYSIPEEEIVEYKSVSEIISKFSDDNQIMVFVLWNEKFEGKIIHRRIELNPKHCNGKTYRYSIGGWGLIQIGFGRLNKQNLSKSTISHFNEIRAKKEQMNGEADIWNWKEILKASNKLKYQIHNKMAVEKIGSFGVLKKAKELSDSGFKFTN